MTGYEKSTLIFDIDGTLCPIKKSNEKYEDLIPNQLVVNKLIQCKKEGAKIILFSSRNMRTFEGNLGLINKSTAPIILDWLRRWNIPYDEIYFGKPWPGDIGFYIDDRSIRPDEFINNNVDELNAICQRSRNNAEKKIVNNLNIVITMAGMGTRFRKAGYNIPKYRIKAKNKTLFEWSMDSLLDYNNHVKKYIFVVLKTDNGSNFIKETMKKSYNIENVDVIEIDDVTDGQATTAMIAMNNIEPNDSILIYNIDTYIEPYHLKYDDLQGDGYIPCFNAAGDHWSFVSLDQNNRAKEVREKKRISDNCSIGAYYFISSQLFKNLYDSYYSTPNNNENGEKYIAPLYNLLIEHGGDVRISTINEKAVHVLGTPEELSAFINNN